MDKLTIEEKAKAYDEAIKRVENIKTGKCKTTFIFTEGLFEHIFPELRESEDERIRKDIVEAVELHKDFTQERKEHIYAWLEKQGEQKPANKVEPKFKVGDWVVYECSGETATLQIARIVGETYVFSDDSTLGVVDEDTLRLWDITKDAKAGDVLYLQHDGKEHIIIYKGVIKERFRTFVSAYCAYNGIVDAFCFADVGRYIDIAYGGIMPATKEQRDRLKKAMTDAGYTFDFEKKELRKVCCEADCTTTKEWSEEDEKHIHSIISTIECCKAQYKEVIAVIEQYDSDLAWLKSLKERVQPQSTWKPSDEQISWLIWVINRMPDTEKANEAEAVLRDLLEQLNKLKG